MYWNELCIMSVVLVFEAERSLFSMFSCKTVAKLNSTLMILVHVLRILLRSRSIVNVVPLMQEWGAFGACHTFSFTAFSILDTT